MTMSKREYQPKTGAPCSCKRGVQRDNCPNCEGTGQVIDFAAIRARRRPEPVDDDSDDETSVDWKPSAETMRLARAMGVR